MFECRRDGQQVQWPHFLSAPVFNPSRGPVLPAVDQALFLQLFVIQAMDVAMGGLLANELGNVCAQGCMFGRIGQQRQAFAHSVDERLLTHRKTHGQRVVVLTAKGVTAVPVAVKTLAQIDLQFSDCQCGHDFCLGTRPRR